MPTANAWDTSEKQRKGQQPVSRATGGASTAERTVSRRRAVRTSRISHWPSAAAGRIIRGHGRSGFHGETVMRSRAARLGVFAGCVALVLVAVAARQRLDAPAAVAQEAKRQPKRSA